MKCKRILDIVILFCFILYPRYTSSGPYLDSAHGNSAYGVNRSATATIGYPQGNCAHCHEQHASIGGAMIDPTGSPSKYAIFADNFADQSHDFCFKCHMGAGSLQFSFDRTNYNYSYWFGGDHVNHLSPNNIYDAFNPASGSAHNLQDISDFITGVKGSHPNFPNFPSGTNPCNGCHNPHLSKRGYPIVRPTDRNNIWGDSAGEYMSDFASAHGGQYHAPCQYPQASCNSTNGPFEPDGSDKKDGSNVPDYVTFCSDCHNATNTIWSTLLNRNLQKINWAQTSPKECSGSGDIHGAISRCFDVDGKGCSAACGYCYGQWRACGDIRENHFRTHPHSPDYYTDECDTQSGGLYQRQPSCAAVTTDLDNDCYAPNGQIPDGIPDNIQCGTCYCVSKTTGQTVPAPAWWGDIKPPYSTANYQNFILNCTDCHEPHGAVHGSEAAGIIPFLLRKTVNGHFNKNRPATGPWTWQEEFCRSCHNHGVTPKKEVYISEFNWTDELNGYHCGNPGGCMSWVGGVPGQGCHTHNWCTKCYSCRWCTSGGGSDERTF